jgi:hypothetical protein
MRSGVQCEESREEVVLGDVMREQAIAMLSDGGRLDSRVGGRIRFCYSKTDHRGLPYWEAEQTCRIPTLSFCSIIDQSTRAENNIRPLFYTQSRMHSDRHLVNH